MNEEIKFSTSGFRAVTAGGLTALNVQRLAHGICAHIFENPYYGFEGEGYQRHIKEKNIKHKRPLVIVGHDTRFMAAQFAKVAANVLSANGITVKFAQSALPTPVAEWAVLRDGAVGAIVITASEAEYYTGGVKWISFYGGIANNEVTQDIEKRIPGESSNALKMSSSEYDYLNSAINISNFKKEFLDYLDTALDVKVIKKAKLKVGVDPLNGSALNYFRPFLEKHGVQVFGLHENEDPLFGGKIPNAGPVSLEELSKLVVSKKLDIGIACNPDCDKFGIIDNEGKWVSPNEISALILEHLVKNKGMTGRVCRSVITSHILDQVARAHNLLVRETPVGFKYITELMMTGQYLLGAEESGGIAVAGHMPDKDGLFTCLMMVELIAAEGKNLKQIFKDFYKKYNVYYDQKVSFPKTETQINSILESLDIKAPLSLNKTSVWRIDSTDGFKFILKDGSWLAVRPSGTERIIRLYAESKDAKVPAQLIAEGKKIVDSFS
jgi:phosphomannomutase